MWSSMYTPHREDPIYPTGGIKTCWCDHQTNSHKGYLQPTELAVLGLFGYIEC